MNKVSKELVSEILGKPAYWICDGSPENRIGYSSDCKASLSGRAGFGINTYEFMHMCKLWALTHGYLLETRLYFEYNKLDWHIAAWNINTGKQKIFDLYNTEYEAVFAVCEWILAKRTTNE